MARTFEELQEAVRGFQESRALLTALELDVFTAIGPGSTAAEVARRVGADARATEMLLNALVALEALGKREGRFYNTDVTRDYFMTGGAHEARHALLHQSRLWRTWSTLTEAVKEGTAVAPREDDPAGREAFIAAMHRNAQERAAFVLDAVGALSVRKLLDLGGGSGAYSIAFAQANPELRATIFDLEPVLAIAQRNIRAAGLSERIRTQPGDLLSDTFGGGYDLALLSAICHMFSPAENRDLLKRVYAALNAGGRVVVQDFILEAERTAPVFAAMFSLNMLVGTRGGSSYTAGDYQQWLEEAGFRKVQHVRLPGMTGLMVAGR
jgi:predicted O-methyltransferase YrrM